MSCMAATDVKFPSTLDERSIGEERLHRKQQLAAAFRLFGKFGFDEGVPQTSDGAPPTKHSG